MSAPKDEQKRTWWSGWIGRLLRLLLAALPLAWLLKVVQLEAVTRHALAVGWSLALALALALLIPLFAAVRWRVLQWAYGAGTTAPLPTLYRHIMVGIYYSMIPTGLAGDLLRGYRVRGFLPNTAASITVVLVERVCGMASIVLTAVVAMAAGPSLGESRVLLALDVGLVGAAGGALVFLGLPYLLRGRPRWQRWMARIPLFGPLALRIQPARSLVKVLGGLLLSLLPTLLLLALVYVLLLGVGAEVSLGACFRVIPIIMLLSAVPLTPLGLGQRELAFVYFLGLLGVPTDRAVTVSLLFFGLHVFSAAVGGLLHLFERILGLEEV